MMNKNSPAPFFSTDVEEVPTPKQMPCRSNLEPYKQTTKLLNLPRMELNQNCGKKASLYGMGGD
jgi:hypothetical protein